MTDRSPGIAALHGGVRVRLGRCAATFEANRDHPTVTTTGTVAEIAAPGATIGRGDDVDLRVAGPASEDMSRRHLLVRTSGRQWTATDLESSNHTYEEHGEGAEIWRQIPSDFPIPIHTDLQLCLGTELLLRFELVPVPVAGRTTDLKGPGPRVGAQRVQPPQLEQAAAALLARRRADGRDAAIPSMPEMCKELSIGRETLYRRFRELRKLEEVAPLMKGGSSRELADALVFAFPYLLAPNSIE